MRYISSYKIFENLNDFYIKINQREFDRLLANTDLYSFPDRYIKELEKISDVETCDASLYSSMSSKCPDPSENVWLMSDDWGLDKCIESDYIIVHDNGVVKYSVNNLEENDTITIRNFTVRINISGVDAEITMCADEWFLFYVNDDVWNNHFMHKCDQFSGVMKLIEDFDKIKDKK